MSTVLFIRPPRRKGPQLPSGEMSVQEPPALPEAPTGALGQMLVYIPMAVSSSAMLLLFVSPSNPSLMYMAGGLMVVSTLVMLFGQVGSATAQRRRKMRGDRRDYLRYLTQLRRYARRTLGEQHKAVGWRHPAPDALWSIALTDRLWERRCAHDDFAEIRVGVGEQRLAVGIAPVQSKPVEDLEPLSALALRRFIRAYSTVRDLPVALFLRGFRHVVVRPVADRPDVRAGFVRAILGQLVTFHGPDELRVVICADEDRRADWEWIKWLPHAMHPVERDPAGPVRLFCDGLDELESLLGEEFANRDRHQTGAAPTREEPYTVVVLHGERGPEGSRLAGAGYRNAVLVDIGDGVPAQAAADVLVLEIDEDGLTMTAAAAPGSGATERRTDLGRPDQLSIARATALAKAVSPFRPASGGDLAERGDGGMIELPTLLGLGELSTLDIRAVWARRTWSDHLRVPIGITPAGTPVELDLKESALGGFGPHGMLVGATGSGKSELLRTLVLALSATHSSDMLNFVLVDFKGGATFLGFDRLPHTSAVITNLADELPLVARMQDALTGETMRRQELLRRAGNFNSVHQYRKARAAGAPLDPLPTLFVVVDEFSELLAAYRDFMDIFVMIGRLGRSLGVHLLLASQRLEDGRMSSLETHLSYRIGLRTFSAMESRAVLGVPDAYELPPAPGHGYMRFEGSSMVRFRAAYVSGAYRPPVPEEQRSEAAAISQIHVYDTIRQDPPATDAEPAGTAPDAEAEPDAGGATVMDTLIDRMVQQGPPAHQVWLPPLTESPTLDQLLPPLEIDPVRGLCPAGAAVRPPLCVPVAVVDRPFEQVRDLLVADMSGAGGHVAVVGGPQSGKSTLIRTLITGLALTHTPAEVQFYCLDLGGGSLAPLAGLPHVGAVVGRHEADRVNRLTAELTSLLTRRERLFAEQGIDGAATFRARLRDGGFVDDEGYAEVFLVIDGWGVLRSDFEDIVERVHHLTRDGLSYAIHVMIAATRWNEIQLSVRDALGTRLELKLGDHVDSVIDIRAAATVPALPGRGLTSEKLHYLTALPRIDGTSETAELAKAVGELVESVAEGWAGAKAPGLRMLPHLLPAEELPAPEGDFRMPIGLAETADTVWHDFATAPSLLVLGDAESGKTNLLRLALRAITTRYTPDEAQVIMIDLRRELYDWVPEEYRLACAFSSQQAKDFILGSSEQLRVRLPGAEITPDRMRRRDWWNGPLIFYVIDDFDLIAGNDATEPLVDLLPFAHEIGMYLVLARGSAGSARTSSDYLLRQLRDLNVADLLLSCPPGDAPFGGPKGRLLPPGRAQLSSRRGVSLIQTAFAGEPAPDAAA
jgi:S-DNA-T family DNA segregation ATPase FtsK/SpoIIIE